jgi:WD40 repeat protein
MLSSSFIALVSACGPAATAVPSATSAATLTATVTRPATLTATRAATREPTRAGPVPPSTQQAEPTPANDIPVTIDTVERIVCLRKLGHDNRRYRLAFSPDGRVFGSYSTDGLVQIWDPASWQVIQEYRTSTNVGWRLFSLPDSRHISAGNGTVWDMTSGELVHTLTGEHVVALSPDGVWMAASGTASSGQPTVELWRIEGWQTERAIVASQSAPISVLAFSPDSRLLATNAAPEYSIKLWAVRPGKNC